MNEDLFVDSVGNHLIGKKIALGVCGGIAAIEAPKLIRHLRRYGAEVHVYTTPTATKFVGEAALEWASGKSVVNDLSGLAEHICQEDLVLVAPATMNTLSKIYLGIADNPLTTLIGSALGQKKPVLCAPTMHQSMYDNPMFQRNIRLEDPIRLIQPRFNEGKCKLPKLDVLVARVIRELTESSLKGKRVLITAGSTPVYIDDLRKITNGFRGTLGLEIAKEAYLRGADVQLLLGDGGLPVPAYIPVKYHKDYDQYVQNVFMVLESGYDIGIFSAAVADYRPTEKKEGKIPSGGKLILELRPTAKVIDEVRGKYPDLVMTTFKFEHGKTRKEMEEIAQERLQKFQCVVTNRAEEMMMKHKARIHTREKIIEVEGKKNIAQVLLDVIE